MTEPFLQFLRFGIVGIIGFTVDLGSLLIAMRLGQGYFIGRMISFALAVSSTWYLNRRFTFEANPERPIGREQLRYLLAMSSGGIVNYGVYCLVVSALTERDYVAAIGVASGSISGLAINFALAKWWVFRPTCGRGTL